MKWFATFNMFFWGMMTTLLSCNTKTNKKVHFVNVVIDTTTNSKHISLTDLLKEYSSLNGQKIETEGIVYFEFENVAICSGKWPGTDCFWLDWNKDLIVNDSLLQKISGRKFVLKGTIDISDKGHLGAYLATIRNIYYLKEK